MAAERKVFCWLFGITLMLLSLSGCAGITETAKGFAGVSTRQVEEAREGALVKTFNCDYAECDARVREALAQINSYIYAQDKDKRMIAVYVTEKDTTPVGIFFKETAESRTQIEVSSPSTYAKELIAGKLFGALEKTHGVKQQGKK